METNFEPQIVDLTCFWDTHQRFGVQDYTGRRYDTRGHRRVRDEIFQKWQRDKWESNAWAKYKTLPRWRFIARQRAKDEAEAKMLQMPKHFEDPMLKLPPVPTYDEISAPA